MDLRVGAPVVAAAQPLTDYAEAQVKLDQALEQLAERGWSVIEGLLPPQTTRSMADEARSLNRLGRFHNAAIGRGGETRVEPMIRSDAIHWVDGSETSHQAGAYLTLMEHYRNQLNRQLYLGLQELEAHYAHYPPGAHYSRHLDRFNSDDRRSVTAILYLNHDWRDEDGGRLRIELGGDEVLEVTPAAGTFVTFLSERYWHEVLPARRDRLSLTGWFKRRALER